MKPRFALDLRNDEIALLHRSQSGWLPVGAARFDAPDLEARLHELRTTAAELEPAGLTVKLVLPNAQVLYTETAASGLDAAADDARVRSALQGATPYPVEDLAYDWQADATDLQILRIAVVARVTLDEAEGFASGHGFMPLSFVAVPDAGTYPGEPFFGAAQTAQAQLSAGETVERDDDILTLAPAGGLSIKDTAADLPEPIDPAPEPDLEADAAPETSGDPQPMTVDSVPLGDAAAFEPVSPVPAAPEPSEPESAASEIGQSAPPLETAARARDLWAELDAAEGGEDAPTETAEPDVPASPREASEDVSEPTQEALAAAIPDAVTPEPALPVESVISQATPATPDSSKPAPTTPPAPEAANPERHTATPDTAPSDTDTSDTPAPDMAFQSLRASREEPETGRMTLPGLRPTRAAPNTVQTAADTDASARTLPQHSPARPPRSGGASDPTTPTPNPIAEKAPTGTVTTATGTAGTVATKDGNKPSAEAMARADRAALAAAAGFAAGAGRKPPTGAAAGALAALRRQLGRAEAPKPRAVQPPLDDSAGPVIGTLARAPRPATPAGAGSKSAGAAPAKSAGATPTKAGPQSTASGKSVFGARAETPRRSARGIFVALAACLVAALLLVALWAGVLGKDEQIATAPPQANAPQTTASPQASAPQAPAADVAAIAPEARAPTVGSDTGSETGAASATSEISDALTADDLGVGAASQPDVQAPPAPGPRDDAELADIDDPDLVGTPTAAELAAQEVPDLAEAQRSYAATGIWQRPPERAEAPDDAPVDDAYLAGIDPSVGAHDAVALPAVQADEAMAPLSDPAAPDQSFALDNSGRVAPSTEGTLSPEGVLIYAGAPAVTPPLRPATETAVAAEGPDGDPLQDGDSGFVAGDPSLPSRRPEARPGDLDETAERSQLNGYTRDQLAGLQPRARPRSLQEAIADATEEAADDASTDAADADGDADAAPTSDAEMSDSTLAVAQSREPRNRPSNIAQIVARTVAARPSQEAVAAAVTSARQQTAPAAAPAPARRATPKPVAARSKTVQPKIPTQASVAASATVKNGIRLGEVALIGVFGTSSNRRALVRLPSGRYVKVSVGDRVNGGQVAAIGKAELRYVKNGRNHVLALPSES